mmetsp:Transcript_8487/g.12300  ORF Transcript_8487/g.12300 Transcript_8487/m.12300 type:complete len:237 (-) Transcript_8487:198-908(-)
MAGNGPVKLFEVRPINWIASMDAISVGSSPVSLLFCKSSPSRLTRLPISVGSCPSMSLSRSCMLMSWGAFAKKSVAGMVPCRLFPEAMSLASFGMVLSSGGMVPERRLSLTAKSTSSGRFARDVGMPPRNWFPDRSSCTSLVNCEKSRVLKVPSKKLLNRYRPLRLVRAEMDTGTSPRRKLLLRFKTLRLVRRGRSFEKAPCKLLLANSILTICMSSGRIGCCAFGADVNTGDAGE